VRLHVVGLPNHPTLKVEYSWSPYAQKTRRFADMMTGLEHEVILYGTEQSDAYVAEHVVCITEAERAACFDERWPSFDPATEGRRLFNGECAIQIDKRAEAGDLLCLIEGVANKPIADLCPELVPVEFGVGYEATFSRFRVFESYAWMHAVHGTTRGAFRGIVNPLDAVIPNAFEEEDYPAGYAGNYLLYLGRLNERKGLMIVASIARETGLPLVIAGSGDLDLIPVSAEYVGVVDPERRGELLAGARCLLAPTINLEPFGGAAVEAQMCGTPVVTSDWGAYAETVEHGVTGLRCHDLTEYVAAVEGVHLLDRARIRERALALYSTEVVCHQYDRYFERVLRSV
jgi:glycosyltransferase involved in cell wall biosynthesis